MEPIQIAGIAFIGMICCGMLYGAYLIDRGTVRDQEKAQRKYEKKKAKKNKKKLAASALASQII